MVKKAFITSIPVMAGYLVLGIGFGILLKSNGYSWIWALVMSLFIYAGAMQYLAVSILTSGASLLSIALTTFMVNCRHMFYGISMIDKYKKLGPKKLYMIFALTDETYSLLCHDDPTIPEKGRGKYYFFVSFFDQIYWVVGSVTGGIIGTLVSFNSAGIDFSLTALFLTIFTEQWLNSKNHIPAIIGLVATIAGRLIFGSDNMLIPSMIAILVCLLIMRKFSKGEVVDE